MRVERNILFYKVKLGSTKFVRLHGYIFRFRKAIRSVTQIPQSINYVKHYKINTTHSVTFGIINVKLITDYYYD